MSELTVLQAVRLKGRVNSADLAATLDEHPAGIAKSIEKLTESGLLVESNSRALKISADGRTRLADLLADERKDVDTAAIAAAYEGFRALNSDFQALVSDWEFKDGEPHANDDTDFDTAVMARLVAVHERVEPIVAEAATQIPRLGSYGDKLAGALARVKDGDTVWLTRPIIDSFHTVWFELHEELILAAGVSAP